MPSAIGARRLPRPHAVLARGRTRIAAGRSRLGAARCEPRRSCPTSQSVPGSGPSRVVSTICPCPACGSARRASRVINAGRACCCSPRSPTSSSRLARASHARIVLLDADLPDGYEREWRPAIGFGPERHFGYALQWFALAVDRGRRLRRHEPAALGAAGGRVVMPAPGPDRRGRRGLVLVAALFLVPLAVRILALLRRHGLATKRQYAAGRPDRPCAPAAAGLRCTTQTDEPLSPELLRHGGRCSTSATVVATSAAGGRST